MNTSQSSEASLETGVRPSPSVTLLVTTGCQYCEDALAELSARADLGELELEVVFVESAYGRTLQTTHRPGMFPLVLLEGQRFSVGRLPRRKLNRTLARRAAR